MTTDTEDTGPVAETNSQRLLESVLSGAYHADRTLEARDGRRYAFVPDNFTLEEVADEHWLPNRIEQRITLDERESMAEYVKRFKSADSVLIADFDQHTILAVLDYHHSTDGDLESLETLANYADHRAAFVLRPSEEFTRWDKAEGELMKQAHFARFLEENSVDIVHPESGEILDVARDLEAVKSTGYKSSTRLENGDRTFSYESETKEKGSVTVPTKFTLSIPLYQGEPPIELECLLRWRAESDGIYFGFEWKRVEYLRIAHFREIATSLFEETGAPVFYGRL
ncbi:DUF2303 family protein [Hyphobacterium sp.]|uniref:DUF2303 family protein n=1 Tax=Hyphobacterium sp. TaxID=2004662 RepID=UPI003BAD9057